MTREEAIEEIKRWTPILLNSGQCTEETSKAQDMAISAISTEGEYIKKEDALNAIRKSSHYGRTQKIYVCHREVVDSIDDLPTYSFPDSAEIENTTVDGLKDILKWGHCYCDNENLSAYKAIKNAIAIITSLEKLKAEIKYNTENCECVPDGSCIRVDKVLEIIDKHLGKTEVGG